MRYLIASDIHGSSDCCKKMIEAFGREKAERILLLGDILPAMVCLFVLVSFLSKSACFHQKISSPLYPVLEFLFNGP